MTFVLITSSGTMAMAVNFGYRRDRGNAAALMFITAAFGAIFVGMQAFEWTKLIIEEGVRPWGNPMGAAQFGSTFFMITGSTACTCSAGVIVPVDRRDEGAARRLRAKRQLRDRRDRRACTGTSSTWCGFSSSRSSISGRELSWQPTDNNIR